MVTLNERLSREKESYSEGQVFENSAALQSKFFHVLQCPNTHYGHQQFSACLKKHCPSADVLEVGCLESPQYETIQALSPARYVGIDLCEEAISRTQKTYPEGEFYVMDAHKLDFDSKFDVIFGISILHHLEFTTALETFKKHLKPGGIVIFDEPLLDNPLGKLLRKLTPHCRTVDEKPISRAQILQGNAFFSKEYHIFYNLVSVPVAMVTSLFSKNPKNLLLKASHLIDLQLKKTPLKWWLRRAVLSWQL